jgi:hypothetical protein
MGFSTHDSISMPGDKVNEDIVYVQDTYGWVLDGATGLDKMNLTGADSDAYWFVNEWNSYLKANILDKSRSIKEIIYQGVDYIGNRFNEAIGGKYPNKINLPSASIVVVRINNSKVEYFLLGDCTLIVQNDDGKSTVIKQNLLDKLDSIAKNEMKKLIVDEGLSFTEARQRINSLLIKHRLLKNTQEGYWTLEFDKNAVEKSLCGYLDFVECRKALLMSDGFSAVFDNYKYVDENSIISIIEEKGLQQIYKTIRGIEDEDGDIRKFPRFKKGDDASAVIFS